MLENGNVFEFWFFDVPYVLYGGLLDLRSSRNYGILEAGSLLFAFYPSVCLPRSKV